MLDTIKREEHWSLTLPDPTDDLKQQLANVRMREVCSDSKTQRRVVWDGHTGIHQLSDEQIIEACLFEGIIKRRDGYFIYQIPVS